MPEHLFLCANSGGAVVRAGSECILVYNAAEYGADVIRCTRKCGRGGKLDSILPVSHVRCRDIYFCALIPEGLLYVRRPAGRNTGDHFLFFGAVGCRQLRVQWGAASKCSRKRLWLWRLFRLLVIRLKRKAKAPEDRLHRQVLTGFRAALAA